MERLTPYVEATVVRAQSPTSVRAGDSAKVGADGTIDGFVGGACAEASVRLYALRSLQSGEPVLLRILPSGAEGEPAVEDGAVTVRNPCLSGGALEVFLKPQLPAATLRVVGTTPIAQALADLGRRLGYSVEQGPGRGQRAARRRRRRPGRLARSRRGADPHYGSSRRGPLRGPRRQRETRRRRSGSRSTSRTSSAIGCTLRRDSRSGLTPLRRSRFRSSPRSSRSGPPTPPRGACFRASPTRAEAAQPAARVRLPH